MFPLKKIQAHYVNERNIITSVNINNHEKIPKNIIIVNLANYEYSFNMEYFIKYHKDFHVMVINNDTDANSCFDLYKDEKHKKIYTRINSLEIKGLYLKLYLLLHKGGISLSPYIYFSHSDFKIHQLLNNEYFMHNTTNNDINLFISSVYPNNSIIKQVFKELNDLIISNDYNYKNIDILKNLESQLTTKYSFWNKMKTTRNLYGYYENNKFVVGFNNTTFGHIAIFIPDYTFHEKINKYSLFYSLKLDGCIQVSSDEKKIYDILNVNTIIYNGTPSICKYQNDYLFLKRWVSYQMNRDGVSHGNNKMFSINTIEKLNSNFQSIDTPTELEDKKELEIHYKKPFALVNGIEDLRIFQHNDSIWCSGSVIENGKIGVFISKLEINENDYNLTHKNMIKPDFYNNECVEKNWCLFSFKGTLKVVYMWFPLTICDFNNETSSLSIYQHKYNVPDFFREVRGSTPGVQYKNEIWFILHKTKILRNGTGNYLHFFAVFDLEMNFKRHSELFKFENYQVEFCAGLIIEDRHFIITFSCLDNQSYLITVDHEYIKNELLWF